MKIETDSICQKGKKVEFYTKVRNVIINISVERVKIYHAILTI